jgi:hypothetical protein
MSIEKHNYKFIDIPRHPHGNRQQDRDGKRGENPQDKANGEYVESY